MIKEYCEGLHDKTSMCKCQIIQKYVSHFLKNMSYSENSNSFENDYIDGFAFFFSY